MTRGAVLAFVLFAILLGLALYTGERLFYLFAFTVAVLWVFSLVSCLITAFGIQYSQHLEPAVSKKGTPALFTVEIRNVVPLPAAQISLSYRLPDFGSGARWMRHFALSPMGSARIEEPIDCRYRGVYQMGGEHLTISDLFGLFRNKRTLSNQMLTLQVLPRILDTQISTDQPGDGPNTLNIGSEDVSTPADVRTYREGDAMKRIHWKLSVRLREWMVRTFELPSAPHITIILDARPLSGNAGKALQAEDALVESVVALVNAYLSDDQPVRFFAKAEENYDILANARTEFPILYDALSRIQFVGQTPIAQAIEVLSQTVGEGGLCIATRRYTQALYDALTPIGSRGLPILLLLVEDPDSAVREQLERSGITLSTCMEVAQ